MQVFSVNFHLKMGALLVQYFTQSTEDRCSIPCEDRLHNQFLCIHRVSQFLDDSSLNESHIHDMPTFSFITKQASLSKSLSRPFIFCPCLLRDRHLHLLKGCHRLFRSLYSLSTSRSQKERISHFHGSHSSLDPLKNRNL